MAMQTHLDREWLDDCLAGIMAYYLTSLPVLLGLLLAADFPLPTGSRLGPSAELTPTCVRFDAVHYISIIRDGYSYDQGRRSLVAFFPAYPLVSRCVSRAVGLGAEEAALLTTQISLIGAFVLLARYVRLRWPEASADQRTLVLAIFGLWPLGLFFRMPYAESLFVCVMLAFLIGMARNGSPGLLAGLAGLGTAVRPVGVALSAAFLWYLLTKSGNSPGKKIAHVLLWSPVMCWGLLAYMVYQWLAFQNPLAFAQTQEHWTERMPAELGWLSKVRSLILLEPIWMVYVPTAGHSDILSRLGRGPWYSLTFWNPLLFLLALALLLLGGWKRWLNGSELVLGTGLLAIPYLTRSYEMLMASHARFAAVVVMNYLVLGRIVACSGTLRVAALCSTLTVFLFLLSFLYAMNFPIF